MTDLWHKNAIFRARKACPAIGHGAYDVLPSGNPQTLIARFTHDGATVITAHNLAPDPRAIPLDIAESAEPLLCDAESRRSADGVHLGPYGYAWLRVLERG